MSGTNLPESAADRDPESSLSMALIFSLCLLQAAYPPNHYIRSVPQRKVHLFTFTQLLQLAVMCGFGFSPYPYLKMTFPILILLLLPLRYSTV